jgi:hypothetical protein
MVFHPEDFDFERLRNFQVKEILETTNFNTIQQVCKQAQRFSTMNVIIAETGYGKTNALEYFAENNDHVIYVSVTKAMTSKVMYGAILKAAGWKNIYRESSLFHIIESIGYYLKETPGKKLLIIDEGNQISDPNLIHLHDLRDATQYISGIVIAGPKQFQTKMEHYEETNRFGMPEFIRRIFSWVELDAPTLGEKCQLYQAHGFKNKKIIEAYARKDKTLDESYKNIQRVAMLYLKSIGEL